MAPQYQQAGHGTVRPGMCSTAQSAQADGVATENIGIFILPNCAIVKVFRARELDCTVLLFLIVSKFQPQHSTAPRLQESLSMPVTWWKVHMATSITVAFRQRGIWIDLCSCGSDHVTTVVIVASSRNVLAAKLCVHCSL